jgi:quercetin dioxygenase-like cupin family protein
MKASIFITVISVVSFFLFLPGSVLAQQQQNVVQERPAEIPEIAPFSAFLSDPELSRYQIQTMNFGLPPGGADTISHKHDCDILVVVLQGSIELSQGFKEPFVLHTGQVFLEKANIVHSITRNPDPLNPVKMLLIYILKEGRQSYTRIYP